MFFESRAKQFVAVMLWYRLVWLVHRTTRSRGGGTVIDGGAWVGQLHGDIVSQCRPFTQLVIWFALLRLPSRRH